MVGEQTLVWAAVCIAIFAAGLAALLAGVVLIRRSAQPSPEPLGADRVEARLAELSRTQAETIGRLQTLGEALSGRQTELASTLSERLDSVTARIGVSMDTSTRNTQDTLRRLYERLAVLDTAQKNLTDLSSQVVSLRQVLANKQARGAFGQGRMEAIVRDGLPKGAFAFQHTLSNRTRPDCVVFLPGDDRPLVIDAKFPLEAITAFREAPSDEHRAKAAQRLRQDVGRHLSDIAERYLIPGETQDLAMMFVPAESVYAELHDGFDDIIQKAYRMQVVIVSPSLLMLAIQVMQQIQKDARMREFACEIRDEVGHLLADLGRLRDRVSKLGQHFGNVTEDVRQVLISADKVDRRGTKIREIEFVREDGPTAVAAAGTLGLRLEAGE